MVVFIFGIFMDVFGDVSFRISYDGYNLVKSIFKVSEIFFCFFCLLICSVLYIVG